MFASHKSVRHYKGHVIESWYDEDSASALAWHAFIAGIGSRSGASREEAVASITEKFNDLNPVKES